jgi:hypothetical protein
MPYFDTTGDHRRQQDDAEAGVFDEPGYADAVPPDIGVEVLARIAHRIILPAILQDINAEYAHIHAVEDREALALEDGLVSLVGYTRIDDDAHEAAR